MRFFCSIPVLALALAAHAAQAQAPVVAAASGRSSPGGPVAATILPGAHVTPGDARNGETFVILEGWIDEKKLGGARDSFPESVGGKLAMRVHTTASKTGKVIAELHAGAGITVLSRSQGWAKVRRGLWVPSKSIGAATNDGGDGGDDATKSKTAAKNAKPAPAPAAPVKAPPTATKAAAPAPAKVAPAPAKVAPAPAKTAPAPTKTAAAPPQKQALVEKGAIVTPQKQAAAPVKAAPDATPVQDAPPAPLPAGALVASRGTALQTSPSGATSASLATGTIVEPLARDRGWVKVRVEGWVNEKDLAPTDSAFSAQLTAADLRADPEANKGKIVRWEVQLLSLQYADPLRRDLARDEPYFLARGPGTESALLYLAVPPSMLKDAKTMAPLTNVIITARVRTGRSDPGGTPILDLRSLSKR